jgi:cellulose synthase operon protein C
MSFRQVSPCCRVYAIAGLFAFATVSLAAALPAAVATKPTECMALLKHAHRQDAQSCYESLVHSNEPYLRAEGYWGLEQYDRANEEFRIANARPDSTALDRARWGMLLHERFNNAEALDLFKEALQKDPRSAEAYFGLAVVSADRFDGSADEYARKALELSPSMVGARELLASLALENNDTAGAIAEADKAIALSPDALDAMAIHASVELLADRSPDSWLDRIRKVNAAYGRGYALVARQMELHYRYNDAVTYYRRAIDADPRLWSARSQLGIALMRMGKEDEPRTQLEMCYNNGYRDAATVNSLRLLDSYKNFVTYKDAAIILRLRKNEAELLYPYFNSELHRIISTYEKKYKMKLPAPVQVEVYPDHEDFAVRTMGMPGLGALGVTFGEVIAMDSPSARRPGDFNWGSTLWHEMSHVFILTMTNDRVPRWFTEGLAVHEEGEASSEWRNRANPDVLIAIRDKKLLPVSQLDRGFVSPEYPSQVIVSYFQAGSICDYIGEHWGSDRLLQMAHSFGEHRTTSEVVQRDLNLSPDEFDKQYLEWLNRRYGVTVANFDEWRKHLKELAASASQKQYDLMITEGATARSLYPEYVGEANAYEFLADAYLGKNDKKNAAAILADYEKMGGQNPATLKKLAGIQEELGQPQQAAVTLERVNYIYPVGDENLHRQLGELWLAQSNYDGAIREYQAVLALNPLDKAGAQFNLAEAYYKSGQRDKAEESVLLALEAAPGYRPAQQLLLQIKRPESKEPTKPN